MVPPQRRQPPDYHAPFDPNYPYVQDGIAAGGVLQQQRRSFSQQSIPPLAANRRRLPDRANDNKRPLEGAAGEDYYDSGFTNGGLSADMGIRTSFAGPLLSPSPRLCPPALRQQQLPLVNGLTDLASSDERFGRMARQSLLRAGVPETCLASGRSGLPPPSVDQHHARLPASSFAAPAAKVTPVVGPSLEGLASLVQMSAEELSQLAPHNLEQLVVMCNQLLASQQQLPPPLRPASQPTPPAWTTADGYGALTAPVYALPSTHCGEESSSQPFPPHGAGAPDPFHQSHQRTLSQQLTQPQLAGFLPYAPPSLFTAEQQQGRRLSVSDLAAAPPPPPQQRAPYSSLAPLSFEPPPALPLHNNFYPLSSAFLTSSPPTPPRQHSQRSSLDFGGGAAAPTPAATPEVNYAWRPSAAVLGVWDNRFALPGPPPATLFQTRPKATRNTLRCDSVVDAAFGQSEKHTFPYKPNAVMVPMIPVVAAAIALEADKDLLIASPATASSSKPQRVTIIGAGVKARGPPYMRHFELDSVLRWTLASQPALVRRDSSGKCDLPLAPAKVKVTAGAAITKPRPMIDLRPPHGGSSREDDDMLPPDHLPNGTEAAASVTATTSCPTDVWYAAETAAVACAHAFPQTSKCCSNDDTARLLKELHAMPSPPSKQVNLWLECCWDVFLAAHRRPNGEMDWPPVVFDALKVDKASVALPPNANKSNDHQNPEPNVDELLARLMGCLTGIAFVKSPTMPCLEEEVTAAVAHVTNALLLLCEGELSSSAGSGSVYSGRPNDGMTSVEPLDRLLIRDGVPLSTLGTTDAWRVARACWMLRQAAKVPKGTRLLLRLLVVAKWHLSGILAMLMFAAFPECHPAIIAASGRPWEQQKTGLLRAEGNIADMLSIRTVMVPGLFNTVSGSECPRCNTPCLGDLANRRLKMSSGESKKFAHGETAVSFHSKQHEREQTAFMSLWVNSPASQLLEDVAASL